MKKLGKKEVILIIIFIVAVVFLNVKEFRYKNYEKILIEEGVKDIESNEEINNEIDNEENEEEINKSKEIKVDICGAVKKPGVIILMEGDRVIDAINKAGGLTDKADILRINRSKYVYDSEKIIIPEIGEKVDIETNNNLNTLGVDKRININTASKEELEKLDGIGDFISSRIIKYREKSNGFKSIEELKNVSGIGESKFEQIKDSIKVK